MSESWNQRPREIANLFNPAFCGILMLNAIQSYFEDANEGMPLSVSYLVLPIVLHEQTRDLLPKMKASWMIQWLQKVPQVRVGFADRVRSFLPYTRESILFMSLRGHCEINDIGRLIPKELIKIRPKYRDKSKEVKKCLSKATLVGALLARAGTPSTIFTMWGVRP